MATRFTIVDGNNNDKDNVRVYMVKGEKGGATWGQIDGIVSDQTDINTVIDTKIETELANFDHLDYKVVDAVPTPETAEEGVRYLYKPAGATAYNEYILIDGVIYMIGTTEDIDLSNYYNKVEIDDKIKDSKQATGTATDTYSTDYLNKALQRHACTAYPTSNKTIANNGIIQLDHRALVGNKLIFDATNNVIEIGAGVSVVSVSAHVTLNTAVANGYIYGIILQRNGSDSNEQGRIYKARNDTPQDINIAPRIMSVTEGDKFRLKYITSNTASVSNNITTASWLTIEVIQ